MEELSKKRVTEVWEVLERDGGETPGRGDMAK